MKLTKVQKKLKDMSVRFDYSENNGDAKIAFSDLDGRDYAIMEVLGQIRFSEQVEGVLKRSKKQDDIIAHLQILSYRFGGDMEKLRAERKKNADNEKRERAFRDVKYEDKKFGDYSLEITMNGLGYIRFSVERDRDRERNYYLPAIYIKDMSIFDDGESTPQVEVQTTSYGALRIEEYEDFIQSVNKAMEAAKYFQNIINDKWASTERISVEDYKG